MTRLENVVDVIDRYYMEERRARAIALVRDRGASGAPSWVWEVIDAWDIA